MSGLEELLGLIEKYGVSLVLLLLLGFATWKLIKFLLSRMKNQDARIKEQDERIDKLIQSLSKPKITESKLNSYANKASEIHDLTHSFLNDIDANRIAIYEYHNGGNNICGIEFKKCSLNYEATDGKTKKIQSQEQSMPLSINPLWNKLIIQDKPIYILSINKLEETDNTIYLTLKNQNIKSYYLKQIRTYDNKVLGFMSITYYDEERVLSDDEIKRLGDVSIYIGNLLYKED
jgi:transcriptional regulator with GAF, ATPase, and Fis domain